MLAAGRAGNLVLKDEPLHLFIFPSVDRAERLLIRTVGFLIRLRDRDLIVMAVVFDQLVRAESFMALLAVHQRIGEGAEMAGCDPCLRIHENRAVETDIVRILLDKFLPPCLLYVILEFNTEITVIPCICETAVDFRTRENESPGFRQRYDLVHCLFHCRFSFIFN